MVPQNKTTQNDVRTEQLPAQEKLTIEAGNSPVLSAEQVYAQRLVETPSEGGPSSPAYIP
jgi:hypothetical protein